MVKCEEMKQYIRQYKIKKLLIIPEDDLMEEMESKMKIAKWEKIEGEPPIGYLVETESPTKKEEFNIYQIMD